MHYWTEEERERERIAYLRSYPEGEDILAAAQLWLNYLGDGREHAGLRNKSFVYAKRLLHFMVTGYDYQKFSLGKYWRERLAAFGLKWHPENNEIEVIDRHRWMHAVSIVRQSRRLPYRTFLNRLASGCHHDDELVPEDLPPTRKGRLKPINGYMPLESEEQSAYNPVQSFVQRLTEEM
jgi:hypothetical protein